MFNNRLSRQKSNSEIQEHQSPEKPKRKYLPKFKSKKLWLVLILLILVSGLLAAGSLQYKNYKNLKNRYNTLQAKNSKLTGKLAKLYKLPSSSAQNSTTANNGSSSSETWNDGVVKQVNYATNSNGYPITNKYVGGTYAPFYLLNKYTVQIPNGMKMERDTKLYTNGVLQTYQNEGGGGGCDTTGITMTVDPTIYSSNNTFEAQGESATFARTLGCGSGWPAKVAYVKYANLPGVTDQPYKYMELVEFLCGKNDLTSNGSCRSNGYDASQWIIYSGLVLGNVKEFITGESIDTVDPAVDLYNKGAYQVRFYITCPGSAYNLSCSYKGYKKGYQAALNDPSYTTLRNIIIAMKQY